jgi:BASS family bile acid:Na+ symporter
MATSTVIRLLNVTALVALMLSMGMQVTIAELLATTRRPRLVALGVIANYALIPAVTVALILLFHANSPVSVGFLILAVCPGAPLGPPITGIARGDVPWAVGIMLILSGLSAFVSPALLEVLLNRVSPNTELKINYLDIIQTLVIIQLLPLALGLWIRHRSPRLTHWIARPIGLLANVLLVALIALIIMAQYETLAEIRLRGWAGMCLLLIASLAIGWICGGTDLETRKAMALTTATRNAAVGLVIVTSNFAGSPAVTAVVAYGLISTIGALGAAVLLGKVPTVWAARLPRP